MNEFKREERYIVIKLSDLKLAQEYDYIDADDVDNFNYVCDGVARARFIAGKSLLHCVVVESDWPEYEAVWAMIEARVNNA